MKDKAHRRGAEAERPSALDVALRLLGQRAHFRAELERKLGQRGYPPAEIEEALARLAGLGHLDDAALAAAEAARLRERKNLGHAGVAAELRRKGVGTKALDAALGQATPAEERERAAAAADRWLRGHRPDAAALARHLDRKGFARSVVYATVAERIPDGGAAEAAAPD
jgi:regulatory protein